MPTPPSIIREPVDVLVDVTVLMEWNVSLTSKSRETTTPPTYKSLAIPVPPATVNAPVDVLVDGVVFVNGIMVV
jgi:hypothetical protein